jgi:hypothetical protein
MDGQLFGSMAVAYSAGDDVDKRRKVLARWLLEDGGARLRALALQPGAALAALAGSLPRERNWCALADIVDAAYATCTDPIGTGWTRRETESVRAHLARLRYHVVTAPFRDNPPESRDRRTWRGSDARVVAEARQARDDWVDVLDTRDDRLALLRSIEVDRDLTELTRLPITLKSLDGTSDRPDAADTAAWRHAVRYHLLPRFALAAAAAAAWRLAGPRPQVWSAAALVATIFAVAAAALGCHDAAGLWGRSWFTLSALAAAATYGLVVLAAIEEPAMSWPWLLRQPASSAIGLLVLATVSPAWWRRDYAGDPQITGWASVGLVLAGAGYLFVEAANHGVRGRALCRPLIVTAAGLVHGLLVAELMLRFLFPVVAEYADLAGSPVGTGGWWHETTPTGQLPAWELLAFATAWGFSAGVGGQILWDDQPVTAPLSHLTWRLGR